MLRSIKSLLGSVILATDGEVGKLEQCFFEDDRWVIRYFVVNTGGWLLRKRVLLTPHVIRRIDWKVGSIDVNLTRKQVEDSPDVDTEKPISRQMEIAYYNHYRWPYYWTGAGIWGIGPFTLGMPYSVDPAVFQTPTEDMIREIDLRNEHAAHGSPHLRSTKEVFGYGLEATDARFGHVEDFVIEDQDWRIRYLAADTKNWLPSKSVLISPEWVSSISWESGKFRISHSKEEILNCPEFDPEKPINREYEERLYDYYGRPKYWVSEERERQERERANATSKKDVA